jgi:hypothetical protein
VGSNPTLTTKKTKQMKKLIFITITTLGLVSCTENERARRFGGTE